jgi:phosphate transport system permease protein
MSVGMTTIDKLPHSQDRPAGAVSPNMAAIARRQRWQDVLFHRGTQAFSLLVLAALMGIMVSLFQAPGRPSRSSA